MSALSEEYERLGLYRPNEAARVLGVDREFLKDVSGSIRVIRFQWGGGVKMGFPREVIDALAETMGKSQ